MATAVSSDGQAPNRETLEAQAVALECTEMTCHHTHMHRLPFPRYNKVDQVKDLSSMSDEWLFNLSLTYLIHHFVIAKSLQAV